MGKKNLKQRLIILPILGLLFASILAPLTSTPVKALPEQNTSNNTETPTSQDNNSIYSTEAQEILNTRNNTTENTANNANNSNSNTGNNPNSNTNNPNNTNSTNPNQNSNNPNSSNNNTSNSNNADADAADQPNCYDVVGSLSGIVCSVVSVISSAVDTLYGIINNFLVIEPITFNDQSPIYTVWATARDIANIVFIILILVVIFSHLTGVGFDNYNIKKTLPRIIIGAILVNISFVICSLAVDASNIIGASTNNFFDSIVVGLQNGVRQELSWGNIINRILGTTATIGASTLIAAGAIAASGGLSHFIWLVIPVVFGAVISLIICVFTIALRQAVVALLIMIAPLAFVTYLLPNTDQYFKRWKDTLLQMLIFFPMFAALYGASRLAGWTFIINGDQNNNIFQIIIGMAIQVFPLIASFKLLKMSNTILGKVSDTLTNLSQPIRTGINNLSAAQAATAKAKYDAQNLSRSYNNVGRYNLARLNPARLRSFAAKRQFEMEENRKLAEDTRQKILQEYTIARQMNKTITVDENGRRVLSAQTKTNGMNEAMRLTMQNKEASLNLSVMELQRENALGQPSSYMQHNRITDTELTHIINHQRENFLDYKTESNAKRRNDLSDEQFYASEVLKASKKSSTSEDYRRLITRGGGVNALDSSNPALQNSALTSVISNAYDITEAERMADINRATTFLNTQPTENVESSIKTAMANEDVNNLMAGLNILDARGDGDIAAKYVREYMDSGKLKLGTEYANNLAKSMLQYSENQLLKGVGKMINVETLAYTQGRRESDIVTFKEFVTGEADFEVLDTTDENHITHKKYKPKYDIISTTRGKDFTKANRTTMKAIMEAMVAYDITDENGKDIMEQRILELDNQIRPQLVSAIPTYNSGSEEIIAATKYLTGMVQDGHGGWKYNGKVDLPGEDESRQYDHSFFLERTKEYLKAFTPSDLIKMKSDVLGAVVELFTYEHLSDDERTKPKSERDKNAVKNAQAQAKTDLQNLFANNGTMATLLAGDLSNLGAMKSKLRELLDLDPDHLDSTLKKFNIHKKPKNS